MPYTTSARFTGNVKEAFRLATSSLTSLGFRIVEQTDAMLELEGPGMNSTKESPLTGISRLLVTNGDTELALEAEFGGANRMARFVTLFPVGLSLLLGVILSVVFWNQFGGLGLWLGGVLGGCGGNAVLWMFVGPWMARWIQRRTSNAADTLLANMVTAGEAN